MYKTLLLATAALLCSAAASFAAPSAPITTNADHTILYAHPTESHYTPPLAHHQAMPVIYQNFATSYPKGPYIATAGYALSGPQTLFGQLWLANAFTPAATASVQEVDLPLGITFGSHNHAQVHIYADANGMPGPDLWTHEVVLEQQLGDCCSITAIHLKQPLKVVAGTQYWIGLTTLAGEPDVLGFWNLDALNQVDQVTQAVNRGAGWVVFQGAPTSAFGIYGK